MVLPVTNTQFNAVANSGFSDNTVKTAYDLYLRTALNSTPVMRHFVTIRPEQVPHPGTPVVMQKSNWFSQATIDGWKTPLAETTEVAATKLPATSTFQLSPNEYGAATATTKFLQRRALFEFSGVTAKTLADGAVKLIDEIIQDKILAGVAETFGGATARANEAALVSGDVITAENLRQQYTKFEENNVPKWDGEFYAAVVHPRVIADIRRAAGAGNWRVGKEYMNDGLLKVGGEVGEFEGFRYFSNNRVRKGTSTTSQTTYNNFFFGYGGLAEAEWEPLQIVASPEVDLLRRYVALGFKFDADWGVYEPLAIDVRLTTAS